MSDMSRVKILERKGGKIPVFTVLEDGDMCFGIWMFLEFSPKVADASGEERRGDGVG